MELTQYLSPREYRETDKATAELNSFMLELFKDEKKLVIFDKDILLSEYEDSVPKWSKTKRTKKSKVIESTAVTMETPIAEVHALLDSLQERLADNIKDAELYYPINVELFSSVRKIKAVIDWLDLRFTVDPTMCKFYKEPNARSRIKELITKRTGIRHYS